MELPGVTREQIQVSYEDGALRIEGEKKAPEHKAHRHCSQRRFGKFVRTFQLPSVVDPDGISAVCKDGILTITLAKRPETKAKKIEVAVE